MSAIEDRSDEPNSDLEAFPTFELEYATDDPVDPSEVTIFPSGEEDITTNWITIDATHAIPLETVA